MDTSAVAINRKLEKRKITDTTLVQINRALEGT
jgi:hypothetical protein